MLLLLLDTLLSGGDFLSGLGAVILMVPVMLFSLSLHETMHGFVALKLGDPTARNLGRLTLNPLKHIDLIGLISLLLFWIGWAKPVPINSRNFKNPKWGFALVALAGPLSNLLLGAVFAILLGVVLAIDNKTNASGFAGTLIGTVEALFLYAAIVNFVLAFFNMIPLPPYDGSRILFAFLPQKAYFAVMRYERYIMLASILVLFIIIRLFGSPFYWVGWNLTALIANPIKSGILFLIK